MEAMETSTKVLPHLRVDFHAIRIFCGMVLWTERDTVGDTPGEGWGGGRRMLFWNQYFSQNNAMPVLHMREWSKRIVDKKVVVHYSSHSIGLAILLFLCYTSADKTRASILWTIIGLYGIHKSNFSHTTTPRPPVTPPSLARPGWLSHAKVASPRLSNRIWDFSGKTIWKLKLLGFFSVGLDVNNSWCAFSSIYVFFSR